MIPETHDNHLYLLLGRMDGKLDSLIAKQESQGRRLDNHGDRIRSLEDGRERGRGVFTATRIGWAALVGLVVFAKDIWNIVAP